MLQFDNQNYPFPSRRNVVYAKNGVVATSQYLASQAGLDILKKGGNAVDAAIATAAALTVVEPTSNGIGGDAFAIVWMKDKLYGLNASGYAPKNLTIDVLKKKGITEIPKLGIIPVTVPGVPSAWAALSKRFGKLTLLECLTPAIQYAKEGYPLSSTLAYYWNISRNVYKNVLSKEEYQSWFETFGMQDEEIHPGKIFKSTGHANTLTEIGNTNAESFYTGNLAKQIIAYSDSLGGYLSFEDFKEYQPEWVDPISVNYRGYDVWELPPNGQGLVALEALNILQNFELKDHLSVDTLHKQIEAVKFAFSDAHQYLADPTSMPFPASDFISLEYGKKRSEQMKETAQMPFPETPKGSGTVYLATADKDGNMVSYIQSNYMGFGSGLVVPGTGISLQNRGHNFTLDPEHPNCLAPRKRPYHTIIPGFLTKGKNPIGPFGVMGGFMQPQGHLQVISNTIDFHLNPQASLDCPRWQWMKDLEIHVEPNMPKDIISKLKAKGHCIQIEPNLGSFGRGQIIWRDPNTKVYISGCDYRTDSAISSW